MDSNNNEEQANNESLSHKYRNVIIALENLETEERIKFHPSLLQRAPALEYDDILHNQKGTREDSSSSTQSQHQLQQIAQGDVELKHDDGKDIRNPKEVCNNLKKALITNEGKTASLRRFNLRSFSISMVIPASDLLDKQSFLTQLTTLDLSNNEIMDIPGLSQLSNLQTLNLERGWFNTLPKEIGSLTELQLLNASRNFLRPNANSLQLEQLKLLSKLRTLDITYNQKCGTKQHHEFIKNYLPQIHQVKVTLWEEVGSIPGSYVGSCASERNPKLLRSQLEPWGTPQLRKRLVQDFNQIPTDGSKVDRAGVMERLLECYENEGMMDQTTGIEIRKRVYVQGTPVDEVLVNELLDELRCWTKDTGLDNKNRERSSIDARNYMILRKPKLNIGEGEQGSDAIETKISRRAMRKARKMNKYLKLWDLALKALQQVNPEFAEQCTEIAVTFGFKGSPHIGR